MGGSVKFGRATALKPRSSTIPAVMTKDLVVELWASSRPAIEYREECIYCITFVG